MHSSKLVNSIRRICKVTNCKYNKVADWVRHHQLMFNVCTVTRIRSRAQKTDWIIRRQVDSQFSGTKRVVSGQSFIFKSTTFFW
jgi:hypothetical protein